MTGSRQKAVGSRQKAELLSDLGLLPSAFCLLLFTVPVAINGCGYTTRPGLAGHLRTIYVKPFVNKIDVTQIQTRDNRFPIYRHRLEADLTNEVLRRYQFTGLLRPSTIERADARLEGELLSYRRDPLRYNASQQVEEWRINLVVNLRFYDQTAQMLVWEESGFTGDTAYFELGANAESESAAVERAIRDLARRIVERSVEDW